MNTWFVFQSKTKSSYSNFPAWVISSNQFYRSNVRYSISMFISKNLFNSRLMVNCNCLSICMHASTDHHGDINICWWSSSAFTITRFGDLRTGRCDVMESNFRKNSPYFTSETVETTWEVRDRCWSSTLFTLDSSHWSAESKLMSYRVVTSRNSRIWSRRACNSASTFAPTLFWFRYLISAIFRWW